MKAINKWKEDVKKKGDKAKDFDSYTTGIKNVKHNFAHKKNKKIRKGKKDSSS